MLIVTDLSGNTEVINKFNRFEMYQELNGAFTLVVTSFRHADNPGHDLIMQEGFIEYDGYKFRIKQIQKQANSTQVSCISAYYDNADVYKYTTYGGTHTLSEFLTYVLSGTGWSWTHSGIDVDQSMLVPNFGQGNVVSLMEDLKALFGFEAQIDRNNQIIISDQLGPDNDFQYRYGYNMVSLTESTDTTKLKTYIEGFGAGSLHVTYTSPYASVPGIGVRHAAPIYDENYTDADDLLELLKASLYDHPDSVIELDDSILMNKELGERVWVIHERMGIEFQTRVVARRIKIPNSLSSVTLGTYMPQSRTIGTELASQRATIDKNNTISRSRIEQTNEKIELEVSRLDGADAVLQSNLTIEADRITAEVTNRQNADNTLQANLNIEAGRITTEVAARQTGDTNTYNNAVSYTSQTATEIRSEVTDEVGRLDGRVDTANSLISQQASEILLRVTKDGVISAINLTPELVRIEASKINLTGAVTVSDLNTELSGKVTRITSDGVFTGYVEAENILGGEITATISMTSAKIRTAPANVGGGYIELWNAADFQPTIRFYGGGPHNITTGGSSLVIQTGSASFGDLYLRAGNRVYFDQGLVDFSGADGILWGSNLPTLTAKFG